MKTDGSEDNHVHCKSGTVVTEAATIATEITKIINGHGGVSELVVFVRDKIDLVGEKGALVDEWLRAIVSPDQDQANNKCMPFDV